MLGHNDEGVEMSMIALSRAGISSATSVRSYPGICAVGLPDGAFSDVGSNGKDRSIDEPSRWELGHHPG